MQLNRGPGARTPGAGLARVLRGESGGGLARIASSAPRRRSRRILAAFLPALLGIAAFASSASAALTQVGPTDPTTNFPAWYSDSNGLALQPCRSDLSGNCAAGLFSLAPVGGAPAGEGFYYLAQATIGPLTVSNALEGAYAGSGTGQEGTFVRTLTDAAKGGLTPSSTYKITDPYGTFTCTSDVNGVIPKKGSTGCRTDTPGIIAGNFTGALGGRIGPFLTWDTFGGQGIGAPPPAGFIGDGVTAHAVVGSPTGFNKVRVEGPGFTGTCTNPDGSTVANCQETSLFIVQGQVQPGPSAATSTNALDFGNVAAPVTKRITYTSTGSAPVNVSGVTLGGTNAADFSETDTCTTTPPATSFAPGATCTIDVTYTPRAGTSNATLTITDDTTGSPRTISLTGSSTPVMTVDRTSVAFANQKVGTTSAQEVVTVGNDGVAPLTVSPAPTITGTGAAHFKIASNGCTTPVDPALGCEIAVVFAPTSSGSKTATLNITESLGTKKTVALTGTGTTPTVNLSTTSLAFGTQNINTTSAAKSVVVTNGGTAAFTVSDIGFTGTDATQFNQGATNTCSVGATVAPGASCTVQVVFAPTTAGAKTANLAIGIDGTPTNVALSGTGAVPPDTTAPSVPAGVKATASSPTAVTVSWTASTDNVGVTGYQVFRGGVQVGTATGTSYSDTALTPSTAYSYTVKAVDAAGNVSAASTAAPVTTPAPPDTTAPSTPGAVTATATNATTVSLSWGASTDNVGVTGYRVYRDGSTTPLKTVTTTSTTDTVAASSTHPYAVTAIDAAGNESPQTAAVSVTTPAAAPTDTVPPTVTTKTPAANATGMAGTTTVTATFSEAVTGVSATSFTLKNGTTAVPATVAYNATTHVATLTPSAALANDTKYTAALANTIKDAAGNPLSATGSTWSFTTGPRPTVTTKSPAANATAVAGTTTVTATLSEAVTGVSATSFTLKNGTTAVPATVAYNATTHVATLTPSAALANDTKYTAALTTAIKDAAGNPITATSWSFTTGPRPTVTTKTPAAGATGVSRTTAVTGTFSEAVTGVTTTTFTLKPVTATGLGTAVTAVVSYNATTHVATLTPSATLAANTKYTATLTTGIKDTAGNPLAATSWSFTTGP